MAKIGRNEPCPCGSGKKYKKCCVKKPIVSTFEQSSVDKWDYGKISTMSTDDILVQLRAFGFPIDEKKFVLDVLQHNSVIALSEEWYGKYTVIANDLDIDFIFIAIFVLWQRLTPNQVCIEHIDSMINTAYDVKSQSIELACNEWLKSWRLIEKQITPNMNTVADLEKAFSLHLHPVSEFVQDLEMYLWNAGQKNEKYHHERIKFCEDYCNYFPNEDEIITLNMQRAIGDSSFVIGDTEKGEATYKKLIATYPMNAWGYIGWGDVYANGFGIDKNPDRAKEIYEIALGKGMEDETDVIERIESLEKL